MSLRKYFLHAFLFFIAPLFLTSCASAQPHNESILKNGGFEAPYQAIPTTSGAAIISGSVADGWQDNSSWAKVNVNYAEEKSQAHGGQSCQKVEVKQVNSGAAQLAQSVSLQANHVYQAGIWLRSPYAASLNFSIIQASAPYKTYTQKTLTLSSEWQHVEIAGLIPAVMQAYVMIRASSPLTYYVDDATLEDVTQSAADQPARVGNLLTDGSFETGMGNGWNVRVRDYGNASVPQSMSVAQSNQYGDPRPRLDTAASTGKHSLRIDIPAAMRATISSPLVTFNFNKPYVASMWLKASRATNVVIELPGTKLQTVSPVSTEWTRVILKGNPAYAPQTRLSVECQAGAEPVTLWMDGAMLEESTEPSPSYRPAFPVELSLDTHRPGSIFFDGENAKIDVTTAWDSSSPAQQNAHLALQLEDVHGTITKLPSQNLSTSQVIIAPDVQHPRGIWKLRAQVVDANGKVLSAPTEQVFARLPQPRALTPTESENSYFGVHIPLSPEYIQITKDIGAHWVRLNGASRVTKWRIVEAQKGQWNWIDDGVNAAHQAGLHILGLIDGAPAWASKTPRAVAGYDSLHNQPNADGAMADWEEYARRTSEHYKGRIDDWEIWNEPWNKIFFNGTPEDYAALLRAASPIIKAANPAAKIIGISASVNYPGDWAERTTAAAPSSFYDIASFHDYSSALYGGADSIPAKFTKSLESTLAQHGGARPLWNTEEGNFNLNSWYGSGDQAPQQQLAWIVRFDVTQIGAGVRKLFYYALGGDPPQGDNTLYALEHDRSIKPVLAARAVLAYLVDGAKCTGRTEPQTGMDQYNFDFADGKTVKVLWSNDGNIHQIAVPANTKVLDVMGNPLLSTGAVPVGAEPVYFTSSK